MTTTERPADLPADMPWRTTPYDPDEEFDPYSYDGSMSIEDYNLMHQRAIKAERSDNMKRCNKHNRYIYGLKCRNCRRDRIKSTIIGVLLVLLAMFVLGAGVWAVEAGTRLMEWWTIGLGCMGFMACVGLAVRLIKKACWLDWRLRG